MFITIEINGFNQTLTEDKILFEISLNECNQNSYGNTLVMVYAMLMCGQNPTRT